jgi:hypothetical protein
MVWDKSSTGKVRAANATSSPASVVVTFLSTLCLSGLLFAQRAVAQQSGLPLHSACGQTRSVLVRFLDATPARGVSVSLSAAPTDMDGPELYSAGEPASHVGQTGQAASQTPVSGVSTVFSPLPLPTSDTGCRPVVTGTLSMITDVRGLATFAQLGEGNWVLRFQGDVSAVTQERRTAPIVPASIQGLFPYGRTRAGGGFIERVDALNEHGGPDPKSVPPGIGPTTSRYVLSFSPEHGGWLPGLDLAPEDSAPPAPLAEVTPGAANMGATPATPDASPGAYGNIPTSDSKQESAFDATNVHVVPGTGQGAGSSNAQEGNSARWLSSWLPVVALVLFGLLALAWARGRSERVRKVREKREGARR